MRSEQPLDPNADASVTDRIDPASEEAVHGWAKRLSVSADQIRDAIAQVGDLASDVELHLKGSRSSTTDDRVDAAGA